MHKIGICFPGSDFEKMPIDEFKKYILKFKEAGVTSFDFYTSLFLNCDEKLKQLVMFLNDNDITITFHYHSSNTIKINDNDDYEKLLSIYKQELMTVRNNLEKMNIKYKTTIVFHGLDYFKDSAKYNHQKNLIDVFKQLSDYSTILNFEILIETLSNNHPYGNHIGDDLSELNLFINSIDNDNFGICWDMGHTRLNSIENNALLYLPEKIMNKVKFTHIHNIHLDKDKKYYVDHLPFTNMNYQKKELEYLIKSDYKGVYSIEFNTENLKENIYVYLDSIKILNETLKSLEEE
jgi:sugar phosphate isomerase/epimerase